MKSTLNFLKKNNSTEWMHAHKDEYLVAKKEFEFLVQELIGRMQEWDSKMPYHEAKNCIFRLNRDIRFSNNKRPYKENFGAFITYGEKKVHLPGYYLHIAPNEVFVAGGMWMPEADKLLKLRRYIAEHGHELEKILDSKSFKKVYPGLDEDSMLKRAPKGFPMDHEFVEFLKFKSFTVHHPLAASEALKPGFGKTVDKYFKMIKPLNEFLLEALHA